MRRRVAVVAAMVLTLVAFDHGMRRQQAMECTWSDAVPCPKGMWLWDGRP